MALAVAFSLAKVASSTTGAGEPAPGGNSEVSDKSSWESANVALDRLGEQHDHAVAKPKALGVVERLEVVETEPVEQLEDNASQ